MAENRPRPTRPSQTGQGGPQGDVRPGDVERALALRDVMDHAVKVHKEITGPSKFKGSSGRAVAATIVCVPLLAFCVYSFVRRPEFIWGSAGKPLPPAQQEAGIRFGMFLLAQRVEAYRVAYGGYPPSLTAVGDSLEGVSYAVVSDAVFELRATNNGKPIVFRSNESADAFLGNSTNIIQGLSR